MNKGAQSESNISLRVELNSSIKFDKSQEFVSFEFN